MEKTIKVKFRETMERAKSLPNYQKIKKITQSLINDYGKDGLKATLAYQRMQLFIDLDEQSLVSYLRSI